MKMKKYNTMIYIVTMLLIAGYSYCSDSEASSYSKLTQEIKRKVGKFRKQLEGNSYCEDLDQAGKVLKVISDMKDYLSNLEGNTFFSQQAESQRVKWLKTIINPLLLVSDNPKIQFQEISVSSGGSELKSLIYYPKEMSENQKLPCIIFLPGGNMYYETLIHTPNMLPVDNFIYMPSDMLSSSATMDRLVEARFLVANQMAFALIAIDPQSGKNDVRQQVKDQVEKIKELPFVDNGKLSLFGHSNGGYVLSLLVKNDAQFLRDNFKRGIVFASSYLTPEEQKGSMEDGCWINYAISQTLFKKLKPNIYNKKLKIFEGTEEAQEILSYIYPMSKKYGMDAKSLQTQLQDGPPVFLMIAKRDNVTPPGINSIPLAEKLNETNLNWRVFSYDATHCLHTTEALEDILAIGQGNPREGDLLEELKSI
ncbi:MAG: hypothetical protein LBS71_00125 [Puniceicoccales bacterium]|nr:hypothetical protein [Puniceicoccales bacterium]